MLVKVNTSRLPFSRVTFINRSERQKSRGPLLDSGYLQGATKDLTSTAWRVGTTISILSSGRDGL